MKKDVTEYDVWLAIRDLYRWRQLSQHLPENSSVFDRIERGAPAPEAHTEAYKRWKEHPSEDVFFQLNHFSPEVSPQD